jgi:hypothetical protein
LSLKIAMNKRSCLFYPAEEAKCNKVFVSDKLFQSSLMVMSKPGAHPGGAEEPFSGASSNKAANIRPGWKGLPWTNNVAFIKPMSVTKKKV